MPRTKGSKNKPKTVSVDFVTQIAEMKSAKESLSAEISSITSKISSALMPSASSFFKTDSASVLFASSAALASAFVFFASSLTISLSIVFSDAFFSFRSAFKESILEVMDEILEKLR